MRLRALNVQGRVSIPPRRPSYSMRRDASNAVTSSVELISSLDDVAIVNSEAARVSIEELKLEVAAVQFSRQKEFLASAANSERNLMLISRSRS